MRKRFTSVSFAHVRTYVRMRRIASRAIELADAALSFGEITEERRGRTAEAPREKSHARDMLQALPIASVWLADNAGPIFGPRLSGGAFRRRVLSLSPSSLRAFHFLISFPSARGPAARIERKGLRKSSEGFRLPRDRGLSGPAVRA